MQMRSRRFHNLRNSCRIHLREIESLQSAECSARWTPNYPSWLLFLDKSQRLHSVRLFAKVPGDTIGFGGSQVKRCQTINIEIPQHSVSCSDYVAAAIHLHEGRIQWLV